MERIAWARIAFGKIIFEFEFKARAEQKFERILKYYGCGHRRA